MQEIDYNRLDRDFRINPYVCEKGNGCTGNTEVQIMHNLGYLKIYDCRNKIWIWKK